tara:strand:- start:288 stop:1007 length:720 start_codon:yes stop_codon:yes gene_type:complete
MDSFLGSSVINKIAILQPNYIPWKGYFDLIAYVDHFVILDDVQFTKRDWRNRNLIKTSQGTQWITVPVISKGKYDQKINQVMISGNSWKQKHLNSLKVNYSKAKYFAEVFDLIEPLYIKQRSESLSEFNTKLIIEICNYLDINTQISLSSTLKINAIDKNTRLIEICNKHNAQTYVSGLSANSYIKEDLFESFDIKLEWFNYDGYNEYLQLWGDMIHNVSILDLLFNCGKDSKNFMRYV